MCDQVIKPPPLTVANKNQEIGNSLKEVGIVLRRLLLDLGLLLWLVHWKLVHEIDNFLEQFMA